MGVENIPLLSGLAARLQFLAARTSVIAENIANADTPNYVARDMEKPNFRAMANDAAQLRVSDPKHMTSGRPGVGGGYAVKSAPDGEASLTGNQVSIETQAMKLSDTRQDYALASSLYRKGLSMLRLAARGR